MLRELTLFLRYRTIYRQEVRTNISLTLELPKLLEGAYKMVHTPTLENDYLLVRLNIHLHTTKHVYLLKRNKTEHIYKNLCGKAVSNFFSKHVNSSVS